MECVALLTEFGTFVLILLLIILLMIFNFSWLGYFISLCLPRQLALIRSFESLASDESCSCVWMVLTVICICSSSGNVSRTFANPFMIELFRYNCVLCLVVKVGYAVKSKNVFFITYCFFKIGNQKCKASQSLNFFMLASFLFCLHVCNSHFCCPFFQV